MKKAWILLSVLCTLSACVSADPAVVARAVQGTLTAVPSPSPIVVVVTVVSEGAAAPATATPASATPTPAATATETAPTPTPTSALAPAGNPTFHDDFTAAGGWALGEDGLQRTALVDGALEFALNEADQFRYIYNLDRSARNFYAAVTGSMAACQSRDRLGLLFRVRDGRNYYLFEVDCDGRYRVSKVIEGALTPLKDWTAAAALGPGSGAANELAVRAEGARLTLAANGERLVEVEDDTFAEGALGLYVGSDPSSGLTARFDDLRVWVIP
jgi:hypothetical protein